MRISALFGGVERSRWIVAWLMALAFVHGALYAFIIPPWQAPDEIAHFVYARLLAQYWRPLTVADASPALEREIIQSLVTFHAYQFVQRPAPAALPDRLDQMPFFGSSQTLGSRFSLAYIPYALAVWPILGSDVATQLYVMRLVSVLLGAAVVLLAYQTAQEVAPAAPELAVGAAVFIIFLPQHAQILASVSDGNLAELLASATLYGLMRLLRAGLTWPVAGVTLACGLAALASKASAYFLIPLFGILGLWLLWRVVSQRRRAAHDRAMWWAGLGLIVIIVLASGWFWSTALPRYIALSQVEDLLSLQKQWDGGVLIDRLVGPGWLLFRSFWMALGWQIVFFPDWGYVSLVCACGLSGLGWLLSARGGLWREGHLGWTVIAGAAALTVLLPLAGIVLIPIGFVFNQGRYLYGGIVPLALLLTEGWLRYARDAQRALAVLIVGMVVLDAIALFVVVPSYFLPG